MKENYNINIIQVVKRNLIFFLLPNLGKDEKNNTGCESRDQREKERVGECAKEKLKGNK